MAPFLDAGRSIRAVSGAERPRQRPRRAQMICTPSHPRRSASGYVLPGARARCPHSGDRNSAWQTEIGGVSPWPPRGPACDGRSQAPCFSSIGRKRQGPVALADVC